MHVNDLSRAIGERLQKLEITSARYSINTPPEVAIEVEYLTKIKAALNTLMQQAESSGAISADLYNRVLNTLKDTSIAVHSIEFDKRALSDRL